MNKMFQSFLEWMFESFSKDASKMLIFTGVAGWTLSSLAQVSAILFNKKISNDKFQKASVFRCPKTYNIPFFGNFKAPRDNYPFGIVSIYKKLCISRAFLL